MICDILLSIALYGAVAFCLAVLSNFNESMYRKVMEKRA